MGSAIAKGFHSIPANPVTVPTRKFVYLNTPSTKTKITTDETSHRFLTPLSFAASIFKATNHPIAVITISKTRYPTPPKE